MHLKVGWRRKSSSDQKDSFEISDEDRHHSRGSNKRLSVSSIIFPPTSPKPSKSPSNEEDLLATHDTEPEDLSINNHEKSLLLGLHLASDNPNPAGDIIFIHGLGGNARTSWCWARNQENFWPLWLANDEQLSSYRVFTFGYHSDLLGGDNNLSLVDFAKDLLFQMLTFTDSAGERRARIGERPIIFVCHSLGGIVAKTAYVLGKQNCDFAQLTSQVFGMLFLGTPHRGAQYAKTLDLILSKSYVADLDAHSTILEDVNEQFRTASEKLKLFSFFETHKTRVGMMRYQLVEKQSAILGYPNEFSSDLNADHHNICKFKNHQDANYIKIRNTLKRCATMIDANNTAHLTQDSGSRNTTAQMDGTSDIQKSADDDFSLIWQKVMKNTCQWILNRPDFIDWINWSSKGSNLQTFCLIGLPATGKSAIASKVIDYIQNKGGNCQHHFFSAGHQLKRNALYCLRSIVAQLAGSNEEFRKRLSKQYESAGISFSSDKRSFDTIWENVFEGIIFKMKFPAPLFWVFDAIDEVDSAQSLLIHILKAQSETPIKIFLTSRPISMPAAARACSSSFHLLFLLENHTSNDLQAFVRATVVNSLPSDEAFHIFIVRQILSKSSGSFLWAKLVIEMLQDQWHTQDDIQEILTGVPKGMDALYSRMLEKIHSQSPRLQLLSKRILTWVACSWFPLHVEELRIALEPEFRHFFSLKDTILQICGHFISFDQDRISLIHLTARRFLLDDRNGVSAFIDEPQGHEYITIVCLDYLINNGWKQTVKLTHSYYWNTEKTLSNDHLLADDYYRSFTRYSTYHWAFHVSKSALESKRLKEALQKFLSRYCLSWIEAITSSNDLHHLTRSAKYLKIYAKRLRNVCLRDTNLPLTLKLAADDFGHDMEAWSTDFLRIVGKFGCNLVQYPPSIHRLVPPFCPRTSMIAKVYGNSSGGGEQLFSVSSVHNNGWDDCLASVSVGEGVIASKVLATDTYFFVLVSGSGTVIVWHAETCEEAMRIQHGEYVPHIVLNKAGTLVATAGIHTYRVWDVASGQELYRFANATASITKVIAFGKGDSELVVGYDDCSVVGYSLGHHEKSWCFVATDSSEELQGCPRLMRFSPDLTKVAVAWRGRPLQVWDITGIEYKEPKTCRVTHSTDTMCAPESVIWRPNADSIMVLCQNARLVEWRLCDESRVEFPHITARDMTISPEGSFLLTSDSTGTMSVWSFPRLTLIYQLTSTDHFIRDMAFSSDGQRFYDTRQTICNVWEPDALVRSDEVDFQDHSSVEELSAVAEPVIAHDDFGGASITAMNTRNDGKYYCCGWEDGKVTIHEATGGKKVRKAYNHTSKSSVIAIKWSTSGRYMVSADDSGRIILKRLETQGLNKWSVYPVLDTRLNETVEQFLFKKTEKYVLISSSSTDMVWDLKMKEEVCHQRWGRRQMRRWTHHPSNPEQLVWIDPAETYTYDWTTLNPSKNPDLLQSGIDSPSAIDLDRSFVADVIISDTHEMSPESVILISNTKYIIYGLVPNQSQSRSLSSTNALLDSISITDLDVQHPNKTARNSLKSLSSQIKHLVGIYRDHIVFLDNYHWLCTFNLETGLHSTQKHFFLPRDLLNQMNLSMAAVDAQGAFLCPNHGRVVIVRNGIKV